MLFPSPRPARSTDKSWHRERRRHEFVCGSGFATSSSRICSGSGAPEELTDDLPLIADHVIDSLGILRLVARLESEFGIQVRDEDVVAANFGSIAQIAGFVDRARGSA